MEVHLIIEVRIKMDKNFINIKIGSDPVREAEVMAATLPGFSKILLPDT